MVLKLDPRFPLLWRDPNSLQFGSDRPLLVLNSVSEPAERVIAALVAGISRSGLAMIAHSAGLDNLALHALLAALAPALTKPVAPVIERVSVCGSGETAGRIADILRRSGSHVNVEDPGSAPTDVDLAVILAHFVIEPELHGAWLRRDIPHLPVVFGDRMVRIGPLVRPGSGPCLYCLELHRRDLDAARPAIAAQLWGRTSPVETPLVSAEVASLTARLALTPFGSPGAIDSGPAVELDTATGETTTARWSVHPACGCTGVASLPQLREKP
jgi:bacteriocin biosynthesis cyclodehydratase domain-containing protein